MKQICLATLNFEQAKGYLPPSKWVERGKDPAGGLLPVLVEHSTLSYILPYVEETSIADQWSFKVSWDQTALASGQSKSNHNLNQTYIGAFRCPTAPQDRSSTVGGVTSANNGAVDYRVCDTMATGNKGDGTKTALQEFLDATPPKVQKRPNSKGGYYSVLWNYASDGTGDSTVVESRYAKIKSTTDGLSQSMMWFETGAVPQLWVNGQLVQATGVVALSNDKDKTQAGTTWANYLNWYAVHDHCGDSFFNCNNNEEIYSFHNGGAFFGFGDGSVHFISIDINPDVFVSLFTRDSNDIVNDVPF